MQDIENPAPRALILEESLGSAKILYEALLKANFQVDVCSQVPKAMLSLSEEKYDVGIFNYSKGNSEYASTLLESRYLVPLFPEFFVLAETPDVKPQDDSQDYEVLRRTQEVDTLVEKSLELLKRRKHNDRRFRRKAVQLSGEIVIDGERTPLHLANISMEGALVIAPRSLEGYSNGFLRLHPIPVKPNCLLGRIDVAWNKSKGGGFFEAGLRFHSSLQPLRAFLSLLKARPLA